MKKLFVFIVFGLLTISCKSQSDRIENDLYKCLTESLTEDEKAKLNPIITGFEIHLIEKGILQSSDSQSYYNLYKKIAESGTYNFTNEFNFSEKISFLNKKNPEENQGLVNCYREIFQSEKYLESKLYEFTKEMQSLRNHNVTPVIIAKTTIKYLSQEDFELEYNRFNTLMFIERFK